LWRPYEGTKPPSLEVFLEYLEMSEDEFNAIVSNTVVAPHQPDFKAIRWGKRMHDFERWYREK
jgi:hypothetical protein